MFQSKKELYEFDEFCLDVTERILTRHGERLPLAEKTFETLCALVKHGNHLVTKDELLNEIWADTIVEENNLEKHISYLRKLLGENNNKAKFIETVRGHGYRFLAEVREAAEEAEIKQENTDQNFAPLHEPSDESANKEATSGKIIKLVDWRHKSETDKKNTRKMSPSAQALPSIERKNIPFEEENIQADYAENLTGKIKNRQPIIALGLVAFLLTVVGFGYYFLSPEKPASGTAGKKSIAVLPFVNASQNPDAEYLSDGITESIIHNLSQLSGLKVMSRNSSFRFRDNQTDTKKIASQLGVETLVTGDIRQIGDKLVINVRLINANDDSQIWGNQYVNNSGDVIIMQNEIARDVSRNLGARLSVTDEQQLAKKYTENPEAYQLFLKGRYHFEKVTRQDFKKSLDYFQQAIAIDPNFAAAYAYLGGFYTFSNEPLKAKEAVLKAISLDDQLPAAHDAYGNILKRYEYDFVGAEREFKRALELDPNDASTLESFGLLLSSLGRHDEALAEMRLATEINPLSPGLNSSYGDGFLFARRYDEAIEQYKKSLELDAYFSSAYYGLAITYQLKGNYAESVEERAKIIEIAKNPQGAAFMRESFANGGWQGFLRKMTSSSQAPKIQPYVLATFYAELGEKEKVFVLLNKIYEERGFLETIKVDPRFDSLRDDPRFTELLKKLNLE